MSGVAWNSIGGTERERERKVKRSWIYGIDHIQFRMNIIHSPIPSHPKSRDRVIRPFFQLRQSKGISSGGPEHHPR